MIDILVGGFYGDEGKGKVASYLALKDQPEMAVRTGGKNAGHTVVYNGKSFKLRSVPSAFVNQDTKLIIPPGALIKREVLFNEMKETDTLNRLYMDGHTAIITELEVKEESENSLLSNEVGSTKQGVGAAESKRILRSLKLAKDYPELSDYIINVPQKIIDCVDSGGRVQVEGSQGHFLSLYHGAYPYVTSRNTTSSGILSDVGVGPKYVENVILIFKAFITRVGGGPLDGEIDHKEAERLGMAEYGTVTGRPRRAAPFDADLAKDSIKISSANQAAITKLDVMFKGAEKVRDYSKLPIEARDWIRDMEDRMGVPVTLIGTGEDALDMVDRREELLS